MLLEQEVARSGGRADAEQFFHSGGVGEPLAGLNVIPRLSSEHEFGGHDAEAQGGVFTIGGDRGSRRAVALAPSRIE